MPLKKCYELVLFKSEHFMIVSPYTPYTAVVPPALLLKNYAHCPQCVFI
jgi:hypothetical protein